MPLYTCKHCNYETSLSQNYRRHLKTKKHAVNINGGIDTSLNLVADIQKHPINIQKHPINIQKHPVNIQKHPINIQQNSSKPYKCDYCFKEFTLFTNKRRHELHRCKHNPAILDKILTSKDKKIKRLEMEINDWKKEKASLYEKIDGLIGKVGVTNNIQNNIIINNYGEEDLSHITDKIMNELVKIPYGAIPKLIESVHFNDKKPENHNIILPNKKENILQVYDNNRWVYKSRDQAINDLIDSKYMIIDNHYDIIKNTAKISGSVKNTYSKFRKYYDSGDEELVKELQKDCDLVLLNHRGLKKHN